MGITFREIGATSCPPTQSLRKKQTQRFAFVTHKASKQAERDNGLSHDHGPEHIKDSKGETAEVTCRVYQSYSKCLLSICQPHGVWKGCLSNRILSQQRKRHLSCSTIAE